MDRRRDVARGPHALAARARRARYRIVQPSLQPSELTITDWQPGSRFVWVARKTGAGDDGRSRDQAAPAGCAVELIVRYEGLLGGLVGLLAGGLTRRYMAMEASGLRAVERCAAVGRGGGNGGGTRRRPPWRTACTDTNG